MTGTTLPDQRDRRGVTMEQMAFCVIYKLRYMLGLVECIYLN